MKRWLPFLLIFILAAALRLIALPNVPPGLQHDEVFHGHDAVTVLLGYHPLYFTSNAGNEPLFIYLMSLTIGLFGHTAWGIRLAAVICGLLTLLFTYLWIRRAYTESHRVDRCGFHGGEFLAALLEPRGPARRLGADDGGADRVVVV